MIFPCRCWLAENEDDGKTSRVIVPGESITQPYDSKSEVLFKVMFVVVLKAPVKKTGSFFMSCQQKEKNTLLKRIIFLFAAYFQKKEKQFCGAECETE